LSKKGKHLVALDVGSAKTCCLVGEQREGEVRFLALGATESKGLRKGQIANLDLAVNSIQRAVEEAEKTAGVPVESALLGIADPHVQGVNSRGSLALGNRPREVTREDVRQVVEAARSVPLGDDQEVLHVLPQEFYLDAQDNIRDPIGMVGQRLKASVHMVTASATATQNVVTAVNRAGVLVSDTVFEPLADAESCLTADERELGCCLIDIGAGTTGLLAYACGIVRHTAVIAVGGNHFSNDLAVGLRTPIPEAEQIKRSHACVSREALVQDQTIEISSVGDRPPRTIFTRQLCEVLEPRAQELLVLAREELQRAGLLTLIPAGLVLVGGGARLNGLVALAEQVFSLPARLSAPRGLAGLPEEFSQPDYATVAGLLLYGARAQQVARAAVAGGSLRARLRSLLLG
jgi:cell division protein FtsA